MFTKVLIANRGVIACRIIRTLRKMGVGSVAVYSDADRHAAHVDQADEAVRIGPAPAAQSYLSVEALLAAAKKTGAQAIHPGYGFLSESSSFADAVEAEGLAFIGPSGWQIHTFGLKHSSRQLARESDVPLLPGSGLLNGVAEALVAAERVGYPVMLKSTAGGGGIGMRRCDSAADLSAAYESVERLSSANFSNGGLFVEKLVKRARHIEVQIFGDGHGRVLALGERDCSLQRRNQKVVEETPAPGISDELRTQLFDSAIRLGKSVSYRSAGTVEFVYDEDTKHFYFLEVNTRLQVEHGVTEEVTGIDLVEWMVRLAAEEFGPLPKSVPVRGHAIQARIYAEDPGKNFQPSSGLVTHANWPSEARVETCVTSGTEVTPFYDPLLAKVIVHGADRAEALQKLTSALNATDVAGIETNVRYLRRISSSDNWTSGNVWTGLLAETKFDRSAIEVITAGPQTTVQDYPGRLGYWNIGVPPSGPMDSLAFRIANRIVGNAAEAAALEFAVQGPLLRFTAGATIAITGADFDARLNGEPAPLWQPIEVAAGGTIEFSTARESGSRAYLAIAGGIDVPEFLGSRSTFILGRFGGHGGRVLRAGDVLHIAAKQGDSRLPARELIPAYGHSWDIGVTYGPHGAPDFFTSSDIEQFFNTSWKVHYNSDRTGVRLIGPKPKWARRDGGEAGLHPSNIHDNAYAIGAIDFTGDMPVILGPDGPSLGGFVCPAVVIDAELWKIGQLRPGDEIRFRPVSYGDAEAMSASLEQALVNLKQPLPSLPGVNRETPVLYSSHSGVVARSSGDRYLLIEFGDAVLDLGVRFRVHAVEQELRDAEVPGIVDITPGVRSLQIHYRHPLRREELIETLGAIEARLGDIEARPIPARTVNLPLSWDDPATRLAIEKYMQGVRPDAPWCPSNIEFIRRINGLDTIRDVQRIVFEANYLVLGLGDVYLGAPVATPLDPRHRLVTTKYNPARTWTPENAVGIGGAYLCVYGMEGPGGYQFVGRTLQMWNSYRKTREFEQPWLLRFFDQIRFYPVSAEELLDIREDFPRGRYPLTIDEGTFRMDEYRRFLGSISKDVESFRLQQRQAFNEERERWAAAGHSETAESMVAPMPEPVEVQLAKGMHPVTAPVTANVWSVAVQPGQHVHAGQSLLVLEAMKMEIQVSAPSAGIVDSVSCAQGALVMAGQRLVTLRQVGL